MRIGILAFQQVINYGATLQIYALQQTVGDLLNTKATVEVINYKQPDLEKKRSLFNYDNMDFLNFIKSLSLIPSRILKQKRFDKFYKENINLTNTILNLKEVDNFDMVIVGSDQVWNSDIHNYDSAYLLNMSDNIKKISYAASIGKDNLNTKEEEYFKRYLPNFSAISVRESNAISLLSDFTDKDISITLDPTLLLSQSEWRNLASPKNKNDRYILVYAMQENEEINNIAKKVSKELDLPIKYIMPYGLSKLDNISLEYIYGPDDFLSLIDNSEFIITNSFHGTCFSVIFNKNFITVPHLTRGTRMKDLLKNLDLENRMIYTEKELESNLSILGSQDFTKANSILEKLKIESISFLEKNLNYD